MPRNLFWIPGTLEPAADADLSTFQDRLREEWFAYFARITGQLITGRGCQVPGLILEAILVDF